MTAADYAAYDCIFVKIRNEKSLLMKKTMLITLLAISSLALACGNADEDFIPGPIMRPDEPAKTDSVYNDLGIELREDGDMYDTYQGLVMCGYQGWHGCPGDGSLYSQTSDPWTHYADKWSFPRVFSPGVGRNGFDFWPEVSEYEITYEATAFTLPDGTHPRLYSAYDESTVRTHFRWMKEYGIDGVFMQRFASQIGNAVAIERSDKVLESAMKASNDYGRAICMMYDMVGLNESMTVEMMIQDIRDVSAKYNFFDREAGQKYYLYHNGKPLIALVSIDENINYTIADAQAIVDACQAMGFSVMVSGPTYWREGGGDCPYSTDALHALIRDADIHTPWYVGRYDHDATAGAHGGSFDSFKESTLNPDKAWMDLNEVEFAPLCFAGYSDRNQHPGNKVFDRAGGDFFWNQVYHNISIGNKMIYIAMFDEMDEGTAIFKCLRKSEVPGNEFHTEYYVVYEDGAYRRSTTFVEGLTGSNWCRKASELNVTFNGIEDHLQHDHYLWLAGQARKMLRGEIPMQSTQPKR